MTYVHVLERDTIDLQWHMYMYMYNRGTLLTYNYYWHMCTCIREWLTVFSNTHTLGFILYSCNIITQLIIQQLGRKSAVISFLSGHEFGIQTTGL